MTRILPASGAELAQFSFQRQRWSERAASNEETGAGTETRRKPGNRRMGDRRTDGRQGGRRASDRMHRREASSWVSTTLSAHLIGQWMEPAQPDATAVAKTYSATGQPVHKAGEIV